MMPPGLVVATAVTLTTVFEAGEERCFRIPSLFLTSRGTLLAFAENRTATCGDTDGVHSLVVKRSLDLGRTWSAAVTVVTKDTVSNPCPAEVDGVVLLHFDTRNNPQPELHGVDCQATSNDDGLTWDDWAPVEYPPLVNDGGLIGPSPGAMTSNGRLHFLTRFDKKTNLYYSDDKGQSWIGSTQTIEGVDECSIAPLGGDQVLANCRTSQNNRAQFVIDGARGPPLIGDLSYPEGLIDPGCQGSLVSHGGRFFLSNNNSTEARTNLTVKVSEDDGRTWDRGVPITEPNTPSAYSQLAVLSSAMASRNKNSHCDCDCDCDSSSEEPVLLGLLFENGEDSPYDRISFTTLEVAPAPFGARKNKRTTTS